VCVIGQLAGVDSAWVQEKLEARKARARSGAQSLLPENLFICE
jgi:hypothetical protein